MKKINIITAALLIGLAPIANAQSPVPLTLKQCVETAISNNLQVRQAGYQVESDKITYDQARGNQLPYFGGSINHGINQGRSIDPFTNSYVTQNINFANYNINT